MQTVNIHEAKTHLSRLVAKAAAGEPFVIAKAGKPLVKVTALDAPEAKPIKRVGFLAGQIKVPDLNVWREMDQEIEKMFYGEDE
jgi:prevent-host-death family protein